LPDRPRQSIETLLHAFIPAAHVDHTHPDAVISLACAADGRPLCERLWGKRMVWVDYIRPGFTLSKQIGEGVRDNPATDLVVMGKHGVTVWADSSADCYAQSIKVIGEAESSLPDPQRQADFCWHCGTGTRCCQSNGYVECSPAHLARCIKPTRQSDFAD
jgi:rhamnose utilization protein RhaD (predicted bifunctional aldolase and dehydrogenase)